ncbi:3'-phosphoadenosine 5'-phosphosulfate sulfotransferase (PAPS reductase)/FAD synthetase [Sinorhizobium meliloti]|nr:hypothetical protein SinmeB_1717 [Sinorhizobium meliloti BL225C]SDZ52187.1 hypothetical protein SAMN04244576_06306 [Sinorhizobium meliloti]
MMESVQTDGKRGENRYFKAPVFAVAPMIDWTETAIKLSKNNGALRFVAKL